ncbi:DUF2169 family type VI secretion system accessory protein [Burkholderia ubonensis]|uniref:DUF2169 family type VI secretion system accessory protein n=1 Tax=Burkholderia ubonensis TaxID=101571 RepID=UPI0009B56A1F|nr:DUF2169 domain-containing protein [Burkholderia ubonensis]
MEFINYTPFPALAFEGIDQHDQQFHVVVLRQTLDLTADGPVYADEQLPLCEEDAYFGEIGRSGVREESDLCQFKPKCDVIVNGTAHAPGGRATAHFRVRLIVRKADGSPLQLPEPPQGLNPLMAASPEALEQWARDCAALRGRNQPGQTLIDKTLVITGERFLQKSSFATSWGARVCRWLTLGLLRPVPWTLSAPAPCLKVPLRPELAFGGEFRVSADSPAAGRVPAKHRLSGSNADDGLVAHAAFAANPVGAGWSENWYLDAADVTRMPAPQIEWEDAPFDLAVFGQALSGGALPEQQQLAAFGVRPKGHPDRAALVGTIEEAFIVSDRWLPEDFDFAIWNAAPPDQQIEYPGGGEVIELMNLFPPDAPGVSVDQQGNTTMQFALPEHLVFVRVRLESGAYFRLPMWLDTMSIDTDRRQLSMVWRRIVGKTSDAPIRMLEAGVQSVEQRRERDRLFAEFDEQAREMEARHG